LSNDEESRKLLRELRDLLVIQLRQAGVTPETIGKQLKVSGKTIRNRYPVGNEKITDESEGQ